ncbi:MAG: hypothetical protein JSV04_13415, partial [Candidatus Heimdallarchaeota archaeon]
MRKVTVEFDPKLLSMFLPKDFLNFFEICDRVEGKAILKYDLGKGVKVVLSEIYMKSGFSIEDLKIPSGLTLLAVLSKTKNKYVCLIKTEYTGEKLEFVKLFDFKNIIFDLPA